MGSRRSPFYSMRVAASFFACAALLTSPRMANASTFDHGDFDRIVRTHVDASGEVAYRNLRNQDGAALASYLGRLAEADPAALDRKEQFAFWINAYNAVILAGVLEGQHAESTFGRWSFFKRFKRPIAGKPRTPDEIEHEILRPKFNDFRVHFAVNCASASCPKLRREAYVGARLDAQLDEQGSEFLNDPRRNRFDLKAGKVELSRIFEWFSGDFNADGRTLAETLDRYLTPEQRHLWKSTPATFLDYDWTLNAQPGQRP